MDNIHPLLIVIFLVSLLLGFAGWDANENRKVQRERIEMFNDSHCENKE